MNAQKSTVRLKAKDGVEVVLDHYKTGHHQVIIIAHGFFNSKGSVLLQELGQCLWDDYDIIIMDFRGHGESQGLFYWTSKEPMDLTAVLEYAHEEYDRVGVIGFSLGAAISLICAVETDLIQTLIYVGGPKAFENINYRFWELNAENDLLYNLTKDGRQGKGIRPGPFWQKKKKPINLVEQLDVPICYIHGEKDWVITPAHAEALYAKTKTIKRLAILKDGPHAEYLMREKKNRDEFLPLVKQWLKETM